LLQRRRAAAPLQPSAGQSLVGGELQQARRPAGAGAQQQTRRTQLLRSIDGTRRRSDGLSTVS